MTDVFFSICHNRLGSQVTDIFFSICHNRLGSPVTLKIVSNALYEGAFEKFSNKLTQNSQYLYLKKIQAESKSCKLFHAGGPYYIETSPLIRRANQWTGLYIIGNSVMKDFYDAGFTAVLYFNFP